MSTGTNYKGYKVTTGPAAYPLSVDEARLHLNLPAGLISDELLTSLIAAATKTVESYTGLALISQAIQQIHDGFPQGRRVILLRVAPATAVTSITYTDTAGDSQTWSNTEYDVDLVSFPPRINPKPDFFYPMSSTKIASVAVNYTAGFGATKAAIPSDIVHAVKLTLTDFYENRDDRARTIQTASQALLSTYRMYEHYFEC